MDRSSGWNNVKLQMDSQVVVFALAGDTDVEGRGRVMRIKNLVQLDWRVKIIHV